MGLGGVEGPPKKKLKQAQLNFCVSTEKVTNKRKLSDSSDGSSPKLFRKDTGSAETPDKENLIANKIDKSKVAKAKEPISDVVLIDEDSNDKAACEGSRGKTVEKSATVDEGNEGLVVNVECKNDDADLKSGKGTSETVPPTKTEPKPVQSDKSDDTDQKNAPESADIEEKNGVTVKDPETRADGDAANETSASQHDKSGSEPGDVSLVLSSDDEQTPAPNLKTPPQPNRKSGVTPKSSTKKAERERQREEKLRLKKEKEEQKRKEKEEKEKKKQEELRLKEEEKRRKEEEKKRKEEAKEEERKRKEEERKKKEEAKEEERRKKDEEKKMKEEDKRKKEEARLAEERKENLAKAAFTKFFITEKVKPSVPKKEEVEAQSEKTERPKFMPFPVKSDMRLAVQVRHTLTEEEKDVLSKALAGDCKGDTYLKELKNGRKPLTSPATWPLSDEQHDVIIVEFVEDKMDVEEEATSNGKTKGQKAKLLQFHENRRPPYWGTWRKPSKTVGPRRPFGQDKVLDYEVDSDSEWEDEEEGEDVDKEDGDSDKEEADDENIGENGYVVDNTFFVPHGYLSDEEAAEAEDDDSVEDPKLKLTVLKQEFDQELKSKTQRLQPRLLGCVYISNMTLEASKSIYEPLMKLRCKWDDQPIDVTSPDVVECSPSPATPNAKFPSSMVEQLAKLIHGNRSSMKALISDFMHTCNKDTQLSSISKRAVFLKVKEIAAKTYSAGSGRLVWTVNPELCPTFGLEPIVDPPKVVPASPVVEQPKPKGSPLASFLKKTPQGPVKRISTTLLREGPSDAGSRGPVHVDTPRPKFPPQGSAGSPPAKPIRRVPTTLLSSVVGPVNNKTFNVGEIDRPGEVQPKTSASTMIDLTDSNDGITPLSDEVSEPVPCGSVSNSLPIPTGSADPVSTSVIPDAATSMKDADSAVVSAPASVSSEQPSQTCQPVPMETEPTKSTSEAEMAAGACQRVAPSASGLSSSDATPSPMETDDPVEKPAPIVSTSGDEPSRETVEGDAIPEATISDAKPPEATISTISQPASAPSDAQGPLKPQTTASVANLSSSGDAKQTTTSSVPKPIPSTPTPVRKRVPLITLSKSVSKTKARKSSGQEVSIADMFSRKSTKKDAPSELTPAEPTAVVDLSADSS